MLTRGVTDPAGGAGPARAPAARRRPHGRQPREHAVATAGAPQQGGDSFGADPGVLGPLRRARVRRAVAGQQPHRRLRRARRCSRRSRRLRRQPDAAVRRRPRPRAASRPAVLDARRHPLRLPRLQRDRRDAAGDPGLARRALACGCRRAPGRSTRGRPRATSLGVVEPARRRVDVVVVLPHWGTQYTHVAEPVQRAVGPRSSTPAPTSSSAVTRTGCRGSSRSATPWSPTRWATSSSTWTS